MNNYNDFPTLSNEQYEKLNKKYLSSLNDCNTPSILAVKLQSCINSLFAIKKDFNIEIQKQITVTITELNCVKDSLKILYPKLPFQSYNIKQNIFAILSEITDLCTLLYKCYNETEKPYYKKVLYKINEKILNSLSKFLLTISTQNIKFFKFM